MSTVDTTSLDRAKSPPRTDEVKGGRPAPPLPVRRKRRWPTILLTLLGLMAAGGGGAWYWWQGQLNALPIGIAQSNGRLEAEQVEIATKFPGRIATVLASEGQLVDAGAVVAKMDTVELEAQLRAAEAQVVRADHERKQAEAVIAQRDSERIFAKQELDRFSTLARQGVSTIEKLDQTRNAMRTAQAGYDTAVASLDAAKATIVALEAEVARLKSQIADSTLVAPKRGRIQYKLAQPGEVLAAGGRVFTLLDLSEVYMTVFLPSHAAGPLTIGDEARVTLDAVPGSVFPAKVTFVATEAQFTPKTVETPEEREKLMFRVKLTIDPSLRPRYEDQVKTGVRGIGYVRSDPKIAWPANLAVKLP